MNNENLEIEIAKKTILSKILDKNAYERLSRIKIANQIFANQIEAYLINLYQLGRIQQVISDEKFKQMLDLLSEKLLQKQEFKIKRR
ncbi:MAG: DNA-binding protein [Candidatus Aenigmatarchaeota archaeon]|nr:DNA-binding protein [Candidatus Aenigmarchaeota archaeon]